MPSRDPKTGKRLPGAAQKRLAALRSGVSASPLPSPSGSALVLAAARPGPFQPIHGPPPNVADGARWAARLLGLCMQALTENSDVLRAMLLQRACKLLGRLQAKAQKSLDALTLRKLRLQVDFYLESESPPHSDDLATHAWAFVRMVRLMYTAATDVSLGDDVGQTEREAAAASYVRLFETLAAYEKINLDSAIAELREALEADG